MVIKIPQTEEICGEGKNGRGKVIGSAICWRREIKGSINRLTTRPVLAGTVPFF